jgi:outer membrane protein assembly factor BamB
MNRISRVAFIVCACLVSVAWGQQPAGQCTNNWSEFHRTNMQRWNPCEKLLNVKNVGNLSVKWTYSTLYYYVNTSPSVANGVVYIIADQMYALNARTGAKLWSYPIGSERYTSSPAVANGVVYVGSIDYNVYALNAKTGALLWSHTTGYSVDSSPAVANGMVYVGSEDGTVYALNASTGTQMWSYATGDNIDSSPAVANGMVYVGSLDGKVYAFGLK